MVKLRFFFLSDYFQWHGSEQLHIVGHLFDCHCRCLFLFSVFYPIVYASGLPIYPPPPPPPRVWWQLRLKYKEIIRWQCHKIYKPTKVPKSKTPSFSGWRPCGRLYTRYSFSWNSFTVERPPVIKQYAPIEIYKLLVIGWWSRYQLDVTKRLFYFQVTPWTFRDTKPCYTENALPIHIKK